MSMLVYLLLQKVYIQLTLNDILSSIIEICTTIRYIIFIRNIKTEYKDLLTRKESYKYLRKGLYSSIRIKIHWKIRNVFAASMFFLQMKLHDRPIYFLILLATLKISISGKCLTFVIFKLHESAPAKNSVIIFTKFYW